MSTLNKNMKFLSPLLFLTFIFCAFPQFNIKDPQTKKGKLLKKLNTTWVSVSVVFWSATNIAAIYKEIWRLTQSHSQSQVSLLPVAIMSLILQCVLAMFSFSIIISFGFIHPKRIHELFKNMDRADFILDFKLGKISWQIYLHFLVFCLIQLVHGYYNCSLWRPIWGHTFFHIYTIRILQIIQFSLVIFMTNTLCLQLYKRFKRLNDHLKEFDPNYGSMQSRLQIDQHYKYFIFKELKKVHSLLCDQVDNINSIFGFVFLCFVITVITMMCYFLVHLQILITFEVNCSRTRRIQLLIICCSGILFIIFEVISLAWIGTLLSSETAKTHKICYNLLNIFSHLNENEAGKLFRKELKMLALQSGFRQPFISTSGIFKMDFGILSPIIGSVTSYIIVAQQCLHQFSIKNE